MFFPLYASFWALCTMFFGGVIILTHARPTRGSLVTVGRPRVLECRRDGVHVHFKGPLIPDVSIGVDMPEQKRRGRWFHCGQLLAAASARGCGSCF